jgi:hypothetical protein
MWYSMHTMSEAVFDADDDDDNDDGWQPFYM